MPVFRAVPTRKRLTALLVTALAGSIVLGGLGAGLGAPAQADPTRDTSQPVAPVVSYDFDHDSGSAVKDSSGNGYDGSWTGTPAYSSTRAVSGSAAQVNSANSLGSYFHLPVVAGKTDASGSFSFEFWLYQASNTSDAAIFSNQNFAHCYNPGTTLYNLSGASGSNRACFGQNGTATSQHYVTSVGDSTSSTAKFSSPNINGAWHYVSGVYDRTAGTVAYYYDGSTTPVGTDSALASTFNLNSGLAWTFGAPGSNATTGITTDTGDGYTNAYVDDLNFYAAAITPQQMQADYNATNPATHFPVTVTDDGHGTGTSSPLAPVAGATVALQANPHTGYHLASWTPVTPAGLTIGSDGTFTDPGSAVTVKAGFAANGYTVHFDGNGATGGSTADQSFTYDNGAALTANGFTRSGYDFAGWATTPTGSVTYADQATATNLSATDGATVNLYAVWAPTGSHSVTVSGDAHVTVSSTTDGTGHATAGDQVTVTANPDTGYHYSWQTTPAGLTIGTDGTFTMPDADVTVQAASAPNSYTVHFDGNGSTGGSLTDQSLTYGQTAPLSSNGFTRTGYGFAGWATTPNGSATYSDGQSVSNLATSGTVTLYAVWNRFRATGDTVAPYLSYDFDGDTGTTVTDSSGGGHDAAWTGTSTYAKGLGGQGKAIQVVGSGGTVKLPLVNGKTDGSGSFSVVFWYGGVSFTGDAWMFSNNTGGSCDRAFNLFHDSGSGDPIGCFGQTVGGTKKYQYFPGSAQDNWHQIAGVVNRATNTVTWYEDGAQVIQSAAGDVTSSTNMVTGLPFVLGQNGNLSYGNNDTAWFDDLDFYTSAITPAQIQNDYTATKPASTTLPPSPGDPGGGTGTGSTDGFLTDTFHAPQARVGGSVSQPVSGLWSGAAVTSYTKIAGDDWLSVGSDGVVSGTAPADVPQHPATITVEATNGTTTSDITVVVPVIGATDAPQVPAATWNLWDAGSHVDGALAKDLTVIATNGLEVIGLQEDGGDVAQQLADALGWHAYEGGHGLGIVSAYPLDVSGAVASTDAAPGTAVTVNALDRPVRVWDTDLDETSAATRADQAQAVANAMHDELPTSARLVLLGDLGSSDAAGAFADAGLADSFREANPDATADPGDTLLYADPSDRVDYVDYAGGTVKVLGSNTLVAGWPTVPDPASAWTSDHSAVVTTFQLGAQETTPPTAPTLTADHDSVVYQAGHGPSDDADLLDRIGVTTDPSDATVSVDSSAVDFATPGSYSAMVTASKDGAVSDPIAVTVTVVPVVAISMTSDTASLSGVQLDSEHVLAGLGAALNVPGTLTVDLSGVDPDTAGSYPVKLSATDGYGYTATADATVTITTPDQAPVITAILSPASPDGSNGWYVTTPTLTASATDDSGVTPSLDYRIDGGPWTAYAGGLVATAGTTTYDLRSTDAKGHTATTTVPVKVDLVAPTTTASASPGANRNAPVTITLSATDDRSGVASTQYKVDDGPWTAYDGAFTVTPAQGDQQVSYRSTDQAGNVEAAGTVVVGSGDLTAPAVFANVAPTAPDGQHGWYRTRPTITASATDDGTPSPLIDYRIGSGPWTAYAGSLRAPEGSTVYTFRATDAVGNVSTTSVAVSVDTGKPTVKGTRTIARRSHGKPTAWRLRLTGKDAVSGIATVQYRVGSGAWRTYRKPVVVKAGRRVTKVSYRAVDRAGSVSSVHRITVPKRR